MEVLKSIWEGFLTILNSYIPEDIIIYFDNIAQSTVDLIREIVFTFVN